MTKPGVRSFALLPVLFALLAVFAASGCAEEPLEGCDPGQADCGGGCADLSDDPDHCGACGHACAPNEVCADGGCFEFCGVGLSVCGEACVNTDINEEHCGGCGVACPPGVSCAGGSCGGVVPTCEDQGLTTCGGVCVDTSSDPGNCGGCGIPCFDGVCAGGLCQGGCPPGLVDCGGSCVDVFSDPSHCGGCFIGCGPGGFCAGGSCDPGCPPGLVDCGGGLCVDIFNDPSHCGGCFIGCGPGGSCAGGSCDPGCPPGLVDCGGGLCVDVFDDPDHCGGCFVGCGPGSSCIGGICQGCGGGICGSCSGVLDLGSAVPQTVGGSTIGLQDGYTSLCAPSGAGEVFFSFTASQSGTYTFQTAGSTFDTVLSLLDFGCTELACNDDVAGVESLIEIDLFAGQTILVVVDGFGAQSGNFGLEVSMDQVVVACPEADLGSAVPQSAAGSTVGAGDSVAPSCAPGGAADVVFQFTAPSTAQYTFDTFGSVFDTVLHVRAGSCAGAEIACNDDALGTASQVTVSLSAGQTVMVAVDGFAGAQGSFDLNVQTSGGGGCPLAVLGSEYPVDVGGTTVGLQNTMTAQCTPAVGPEMTYLWTAPFDGLFTFDTNGSSYDTVLYLRAGACGGPEIACNDDFMGVSSQVATLMTAGQSVVVVVDGFGAGSYQLNIK